MNAWIAVLATATLAVTGSACSSTSDAPPSSVATTSPSATPTATPSATPSTPTNESPLATPTQVIPPASDISFPEGSTYWRNSARIPVIVYRAAENLCWYYWTGLEVKQQFTGTLTPTEGLLQWQGIFGTYAYPGQTPSSVPMTVEFNLLGDSGNWKVTRTDQPSGGAGAFLLNDAWAPITAQEAAEDFSLTSGLSGYDAPTLTSCPTPADFAQ